MTVPKAISSVLYCLWFLSPSGGLTRLVTGGSRMKRMMGERIGKRRNFVCIVDG